MKPDDPSGKRELCAFRFHGYFKYSKVQSTPIFEGFKYQRKNYKMCTFELHDSNKWSALDHWIIYAVRSRYYDKNTTVPHSESRLVRDGTWSSSSSLRSRGNEWASDGSELWGYSIYRNPSTGSSTGKTMYSIGWYSTYYRNLIPYCSRFPCSHADDPSTPRGGL